MRMIGRVEVRYRECSEGGKGVRGGREKRGKEGRRGEKGKKGMTDVEGCDWLMCL